MKGTQESGAQAASMLGSFVAEHEDRLAKRALKVASTDLEEALPTAQLRGSLAAALSELGTLLLERGDDAPRLFGEAVRHLGGSHFERRAAPAELVRLFNAVQVAIQEEWSKRVGELPVAVHGLLCECVCEGTAAAVTDYVRTLRAEQGDFRETALIETILTHLDSGILVVEADGTLSFATRPAHALLGPALQGAIGLHFSGEGMRAILKERNCRALDGAGIGVQDLPAFQVLSTQRPAGPLLMRIALDSDERVLEVNALPIFAEDEPSATGPRAGLRGVITTLRDRTEEIRKSEELRAAYLELTDLHRRLLHRSRAQAMGELAAGAAHALNNLLNPMHLRLRLLRENPGQQEVESLARSVSDIATLVSRLQQFSAHRTGGRLEAIPIDRMVQETLELVRPEVGRAGELPVRVVTRLESEALVRANPAELRELLATLLLHAREDLADSAELFVETRRAYGGGRDRVECRVRYLPEAAARLEGHEAPYEPFTSTRTLPSLDLVLTSAREAMSLWQGTAQARALPAGEMEFVLSFPAAEASPSAEAPEPAPSTGSRGVLVVDDDPDNASMLAQVLENEGHRAVTATTGKDAVARWEQEAFDVALVDLLMPDMTGIAIAKALRALRPSARVALVTGWELTETQRRAAEAHEVFRKPVDINRLLTFIAGREEQPRAQ